MLTLGEVRGQARVVDLLRRSMAGERLAQAYLFTGPAGCGKHHTALALAKAVNCEAAPGEGCGDCNSCRKIDSGNHPDIRTIVPEPTKSKKKTDQITIKAIRNQVLAALAMSPHEAKARFFLVQEMAVLTGEAANALLKTLEEPPPRTHLVLCTRSPSQVLPTIRSRCQRVSFLALDPALQAELRGEGEEAGSIASLAENITNTIEQRGLEGILAVAKSATDRGILERSLEQVAQSCHAAARAAADSHSLEVAHVHARRAAEVLNSLVAIREHNAHGQLAVEHLLVALRDMPLPSAPLQPRRPEGAAPQ